MLVGEIFAYQILRYLSEIDRLGVEQWDAKFLGIGKSKLCAAD